MPWRRGHMCETSSHAKEKDTLRRLERDNRKLSRMAARRAAPPDWTGANGPAGWPRPFDAARGGHVMACTAAACQTRPTRTGASEDPLPPAVRNRQAAVLYLRAARLADRER